MSFWTADRDAQLKSLWAIEPHIKLKEIATILSKGGTRVIANSYVSSHAYELGLPSRNSVGCKKILVRKEIDVARSSSYLEKEAMRRGIPVAELIRRIMSTVTKDRMVNAILDDDMPEVEAPAISGVLGKAPESV